MKKVLMTYAATVFCLYATIATGAEYTARRGDTLTSIAKKVGFTPIQVAEMNQIKLQDVVLIGQKFKYFTDEDIEDAKSWCKKRMSELPPRNEDYDSFRGSLEDLKKRIIRFSINEPVGVHVSSIFVYAEAWRKQR